jgi:hypothetical protein
MRAIQDTIEDKITDALLEDDYDNGHTFNLIYKEEMDALSIA